MKNTMPHIGEKAPAFLLKDQHGKSHRLSAAKGSWVLLYFYPKDNTSGCTKEACAIRDAFPSFSGLKAQVFGVSPDSVASHEKFADEYELPFPLLADVDKKVARAYGVWQRKSMMGNTFMGIVRTSFLIDPKGKIAKVYEKVKPEAHAQEVIADLNKLVK
jgi:peroxiredoxin Q/BCP